MDLATRIAGKPVYKKEKTAAKKKMPHFTEQDRPRKAKEIYEAMTEGSSARELKQRYGKRWKEVAARVAGRHGKPGKQHVGRPYKEPV